jgi:uncharacterized protein
MIAAVVAASVWMNELADWRKKQDERLRAEGGWLSVVGLQWLKDGDNPLAGFGTVRLEKGRATYEGQELKDDTSGEATAIKKGARHFFLIKRGDKIGARIKDNDAPARRNFKGRKWFPPDPKLVIRAKWTPYDPPKKLEIPNVLGMVDQEDCPGAATFELDGKTVSLSPTGALDDLFFVFKDKTSGRETYGAGRFLSAGKPENGELVLDFNRAVSPPCAFTAYATCPMPPKENRLPVAIRAGELKPEGH